MWSPPEARLSLSFQEGFRVDHMVIHRLQSGKGRIRKHKAPLQGKVTEPLSDAVHRSFQFFLFPLFYRILIQ